MKYYKTLITSFFLLLFLHFCLWTSISFLSSVLPGQYITWDPKCHHLLMSSIGDVLSCWWCPTVDNVSIYWWCLIIVDVLICWWCPSLCDVLICWWFSSFDNCWWWPSVGDVSIMLVMSPSVSEVNIIQFSLVSSSRDAARGLPLHGCAHISLLSYIYFFQAMTSLLKFWDHYL